MARTVEIEAARRSFLTAGWNLAGRDDVRPEVLASWQRSQDHDVDPDRITARFLGHHRDAPPLVVCGEEVFDEFRTANPDADCSLVLLDAAGVVRSRRDADPALGTLLDGVLLVPGYGFSERAVGTTAASVALHEQQGAAVSGPEHYHSRLQFLAEAAAPVVDGTGTCGVVSVLGHESRATTMALPLARLLAERISDRVAGEPDRRARAVLDVFRGRCVAAPGEWVLATDGQFVLTNPAVRRLDGADQRVLSDLLLAALACEEEADTHVDLPSGSCAEVATERVHLGGHQVGTVLAGGPAGAPRAAEQPESVRRQGSHVAPTARRDYAQDLRGSARRAHAAARIRANRELLTPYLRARHEVAATLSRGRSQLLIGEPGVGKRQLVLGQFRQAYPHGRVTTVDCASFGAESGAGLGPLVDDRPQLVLLAGLNTLTAVGARRLDEALRPLVVLAAPPRVVGCVDTPAVDATRPYGLLLRHFHEITRVPALRHRLDEIGDIALSILRTLAGRRSLRLSLQVVRVLEGYAWPGNISELEDVLRYVVAHKPVGEIQPPDLPPLCFQGRQRKLSMLESAQCDAIIQALYESGGNRYKAAAMLGIARSSLYRKIDAFGISYIA
ncbi:helix-turn-helix domain-containing protein [Pseudonocardia sp.]|uniref:sigma-54-dependent Fis family transcriptional regulator n=1 Tax=Pseudonocardia sp. TaxID=60912 RepID=UPI0026284131|nr:helix-turn-helix domain-containing protein [Pseudonocardia sp.]